MSAYPGRQPDGAAADIPYEDYGGQGPVVHFAHANAYPPGSYSALLKELARDHRVLAVKHRPLWAGSDPSALGDWGDIAGDLLAFLDGLGLKQVVGVGHSLGAVTTMMAALARPELFRALVLIEPVFLPPRVLALFERVKQGAQPTDIPWVRMALNRRQHWPSHRDAFEHFRPKRVFGRLSDEALWDYVRHGLEEDEQGVRLAYPRAWEARIYALPPTQVWDQIGRVTQPTLAMRGRHSDTLAADSWQMWQELQPGATFVQVEESGHLLPMERPARVAAEIREFVAAAGQGSA
jgi:pimeloyl-ACP methyl ester carboxylesterase